MAMGVQGHLAVGGFVTRCPRALARGVEGGKIDAEACTTRCSYCRRFCITTANVGDFKKGVGFPKQRSEVSHVFCAFPHTNEAPKFGTETG